MSGPGIRIFRTLLPSAGFVLFSGPFSALTVNFSPNIDLDYGGSLGQDGYEALAVEFNGSAGPHQNMVDAQGTTSA